MGPGLAIKAVAGRSFSLLVFGFSQVATDLEPLVRILRGDAEIHGFSHTYLGAALIGAGSAVIGRPICQWLHDRRPARSERAVISWPAAISGAFVGTFSHVFLDSIMHADMHPSAPWSEANGMLRAIPVGDLRLACMLAGVAGSLLLLARVLLRRRARTGPGTP